MPNISSDYAKNRAMKSEKAKKFIDGCINNLAAGLADYAKWQIRTAMTHTADLAEREAEEWMQTKAHKIVKEMMTGIFQGDMPRKIADEFIQKLNDDEND